MNAKIEIIIDEMDRMHVRSNLVEREHMVEVLQRAIRNLSPKIIVGGFINGQTQPNQRRSLPGDRKKYLGARGITWPDA